MCRGLKEKYKRSGISYFLENLIGSHRIKGYLVNTYNGDRSNVRRIKVRGIIRCCLYLFIWHIRTFL